MNITMKEVKKIGLSVLAIFTILGAVVVLTNAYKGEYNFHTKVNMESVDKLVKYLKAHSQAPIEISYESNGGTTTAAYYAIANLKDRKITGVVESACYSACAMMLVTSKHIKMGERALILFHMPRIKLGPILGDIVLTPDNENPYYKAVAIQAIDFAREYIKPLLTADEWRDFKAGKDIVINGPDFQKRWDAVRKYKGDK